MEYTNHIMKAANAQAIQDALDAGTLVNPYVAMTSSGTLDFNSLSPSPVPSTGAWILTSDGDLIEGVYDSGQSEQYPYDVYEFGAFSASTAATYTLYYGGSIVTADYVSFQYQVGDDLETAVPLQFDYTDYTVEDVPVIIDSGMSESLTEDYVDVLSWSFLTRKSDGSLYSFDAVIQVHGDVDVCTYWEMAYQSYSECRCMEHNECPMGTWTDDGEGNYTFQITETNQSYWNETYIGTINSIEYAGTTDAAEIVLTPGADDGSWDMKIHQENGTETIVQTFEEGTSYTWNDSGFMVDSGDSDSTLQVYWDGSGSFTFNSGSSAHPVSISTYDPIKPSEE